MITQIVLSTLIDIISLNPKKYFLLFCAFNNIIIEQENWSYYILHTLYVWFDHIYWITMMNLKIMVNIDIKNYILLPIRYNKLIMIVLKQFHFNFYFPKINYLDGQYIWLSIINVNFFKTKNLQLVSLHYSFVYFHYIVYNFKFKYTNKLFRK